MDRRRGIHQKRWIKRQYLKVDKYGDLFLRLKNDVRLVLKRHLMINKLRSI